MSKHSTDSYLTLKVRCTHEIKIKGSRFIAIGCPVENPEKAREILDNIRKTEYSATHHCFAYTTGLENEVFKYS